MIAKGVLKTYFLRCLTTPYEDMPGLVKFLLQKEARMLHDHSTYVYDETNEVPSGGEGCLYSHCDDYTH